MFLKSRPSSPIRSAVLETLEGRRLLAYAVPNDYVTIGGATPDPTTGNLRNITSGGIAVQLQPGENYIAVATGIARIANDNRLADAQYAQNYATAPAWTELAANNPLVFDGTSTAWTGGNPSAGDHTFGKTISPTSSMTARVKFSDTQYNDNGYAESVSGYTTADRLKATLYQQIKLNSLTASETGNTSNAVTDADGSPDDLYVPTNANGQATVDLAASFTLANKGAGARVLWSVEGAGTNPSTSQGTFASGNQITFAPNGTDVATVNAGLDANGNGQLDSSEVSRTVEVHFVPLVTIEPAETSGASVVEGESKEMFIVKRSFANGALAVTLSLSGDATPIDDYTLDGYTFSGNYNTDLFVHFSAGETQKTITLSAVDDHVQETDEHVYATIQEDVSISPSYTLGDTTSAEATIEDYIAAPSGLEASLRIDDDYGYISLTWEDNSDNETGFQIEVSIDGGSNWEAIGTTGEDVTTFELPLDRDDATPYSFRVFSKGSGGRLSGPSNTAERPWPLNGVITNSTNEVARAWNDQQGWHDVAANETTPNFKRDEDYVFIDGKYYKIGSSHVYVRYTDGPQSPRSVYVQYDDPALGHGVWKELTPEGAGDWIPPGTP